MPQPVGYSAIIQSPRFQGVEAQDSSRLQRVVALSNWALNTNHLPITATIIAPNGQDISVFANTDKELSAPLAGTPTAHTEISASYYPLSRNLNIQGGYHPFANAISFGNQNPSVKKNSVSSPSSLHFGSEVIEKFFDPKRKRTIDLPPNSLLLQPEDLHSKERLKETLCRELGILQGPIVELLGYTKLHGPTKTYQQADYDRSVQQAFSTLLPILKEESGGQFIGLTSASTGLESNSDRPAGVDFVLKNSALSKSKLTGNTGGPLLMLTSLRFAHSAKIDTLPKTIQTSYAITPKFWTQTEQDFVKATSLLTDIIILQGGGGLSLGELIAKAQLDEPCAVIVIEDSQNPVTTFTQDVEGKRVTNTSRLIVGLLEGKLIPEDIPPFVSKNDLQTLLTWLKKGNISIIKCENGYINQANQTQVRKFLQEKLSPREA